MSDQRSNTTDPVVDPDEAFVPLLRDLRAMPKIDAPLDFEYQLKQRLAAASVPRLSWWQRLPVINLGFLRVPALAYGPVAGMAVLAFTLYVYETRDLPKQIESVPIPVERVEEGLQSPEPSRPKSDPLSPASEQERKLREQQAAERRAQRSTEQSAPASERSKAAPAPDSRVGGTPSRISGEKSDEALDIPVLRGVVDDEATLDTSKKDSVRTYRVQPSLRPAKQRTDRNPATRKPREN